MDLEDPVTPAQRAPQPREPAKRPDDGHGRARNAGARAHREEPNRPAVEFKRHPPAHRPGIRVARRADERDLEVGRRVFDEVAQEGLDAAERWRPWVAWMDDQDSDGGWPVSWHGALQS